MKNNYKHSHIEQSSVFFSGFIKNLLLFIILISYSLSFSNSIKILRPKVSVSADELLNKHPLKALVNFDILRSFRDKKEYHSFTLPNGLDVLIVSDPKLTVAAASISVNSGVNKEDEAIHGLAHYCEHMLFLGSKKYPNPTGFVDYISKNFGKFNGFTDFEVTGFFFKVVTEAFHKGFDLFANFFIDPLFDKTYYIKEVNSVNSEFERNIQSDKKRKEQVLRDNANKGSLFNKFSTGNTNTLLGYTKANGISLRDEVIKYFKKNYRIDNMKVVIYGNEDVSIYKKLVEETFRHVERPASLYNKEAPARNEAFNESNLGRLILYKTINDHQKLDISIKIPDIHKGLPNNQSLLYRLLICKKGKGSLNDILKEKGYLIDLKCGVRRVYNGLSLFKLGGFITIKGIKNVDKVLTTIYGYINNLKSLVLDEKIYNFYRKALSRRFQYSHRNERIMKFMKHICIGIWKYPLKYILAKHSLLPEYDASSITKFSNLLTLSNSVILIGNKKFTNKTLKRYNQFIDNFETSSLFKKQDNWYHTKYSPLKFASSLIESTSSTILDVKINLYRTTEKDFAKNISLVKRCEEDQIESCINNMEHDNNFLKPVLIKNDENMQCWYKWDRSYFVSKVDMFIKFVFNGNVNDPNHSTLLRLYVLYLNQSFANFYHDETLRQNHYHINASPTGFTIRIYSFEDLINETASTFLEKIRKLSFNLDSFILVKDKLKNLIESKTNLVPALQAYLNFFSLILKDYVRSHHILEEIDKITFSQFNNFTQNLYNQMFIKTFIHGAINEKKAKNLSNMVQTLFGSFTPVSNKSLINYQNKHADLSGYFVYREKLKNIYNINHAVLNFYQIGVENVKNMLFANIVKEICAYIYFTELRVKQQLGYVAKGKVFSEGNIIYYMIMVQGSKKTPDYMDLRIDDLLDKMKDRITNTADSRLTEITNKVIKKLSKKDSTIKRRTNRLWSEIITERGYYDMKSLFKNEETKFTKQDVLDFFERVFTKKLKKLSVQEFSYLTPEIPQGYNNSRDLDASPVDTKDFFRLRNKFILQTHDVPESNNDTVVEDEVDNATDSLNLKNTTY